MNHISEHREYSNWGWFFETLPHKQRPYSSRNWGHPLHSACSYRGKLKPAIAHFLIKAFTEPGSLVLDPFAGAGTIPFEAALQGRRTIGFDISRMGTVITRAKIGMPDRDELHSKLIDLENHINNYTIKPNALSSAQNVAFNKPIPEYFHPETMREVLACREFFRDVEDTDETAIMLTCMLHILHGNRPYSLSRRSHPITPFAPTGAFEYRDVMTRLRAKLERVLQSPLPAEYVSGKAYARDACDDWTHITGQVDTVITSPPFAGSTRFYMQNWMRFWFCGWEPQDFERSNTASYFEDMQRDGFDCYTPVLKNISRSLSANGRVVFHLGESNKHDMALELSNLAAKDFRHRFIFTENVRNLEGYGVSDKGATTSHQYLILEK